MRSLILSALALFGLSGFTTGQFGTVDLSYGFESVEVASGPDTFELFEFGSSDLSLSAEFAFRGQYSLHLRDFSENSNFPEFQGYFPVVRGGKIEIGFALMTPTPEEPFNIAFAGDQHFKMAQNGIGFWLLNDSGILRHISDSIPKKLLELVPFKWYWFDISLDLSKGVYSLNVSDEFGSSLVKLEDQQHPINAKNSNLRKYSFAGDIEDRGNANFYIDEFFLRTDFAENTKPFIAPGRRTLFVDQWNTYHRELEKIRFCLAPKLPYDFIDIYNTQGLEVLQENSDLLKTILTSSNEEDFSEFAHERDLIQGISMWALGCLELKNGKYERAIESLELARKLIGNSPATQMGLALAFANIGDYYGAQIIIDRGHQSWYNDARWAVLSAAIGFLSSREENSEHVLSVFANSVEADIQIARTTMQEIGWLNHPAVKNIQKQKIWNEDAELFILAEQYYFSLLWQSKYRQAESYAENFIRILARYDIVSPLWFERVGDAALFGENLRNAEKYYINVLNIQNDRLSTLQKLADVYYLQSRIDDEREIRESIYGALNYE